MMVDSQNQDCFLVVNRAEVADFPSGDLHGCLKALDSALCAAYWHNAVVLRFVAAPKGKGKGYWSIRETTYAMI